jgi:hypothetical protein
MGAMKKPESHVFERWWSDVNIGDEIPGSHETDQPQLRGGGALIIRESNPS